ncbi:hypothetical protein [Paenibacillus sp. B01]|nr:hypothetical protein [Paenibacillus sp. B01]
MSNKPETHGFWQLHADRFPQEIKEDIQTNNGTKGDRDIHNE